MLVACAAAILILFRTATDEDERSRDVGPAIVARLVRATGSVQLLSPGSSNWASVSAESQETIQAGSRIRTSERVLCEFETVDNGKIRLNQSAEVVWEKPDRLQLVSGQLWCLSPGNATIKIDVGVSDIESPQFATMACPGSSEIQCVAGGGLASCASVASTNPEASFSTRNFTCAVAPGETVSVDAAETIHRQSERDAASKIWQLPLLAASATADTELLSSLNQLLADVGMSKAKHFNEEQLRSLGPAGAIPLLVYAASESSPEHLPLRRKAVELAGETADRRSLPLLGQLSADADPQIAASASVILGRLKRGQDSF